MRRGRDLNPRPPVFPVEADFESAALNHSATSPFVIVNFICYNYTMEIINYELIKNKYPWLFEENKKIIISPDVDGLLCGLLMSNYLRWEIVGFYDGKILCFKKELKIKDCIFLDIEIFRKEIKSIGHHMLIYDLKDLPENWDNFENSLNPNNLRRFDMLHNFKRKYPFATIHLLLCFLKEIKKEKIEFPNTATGPLLYVDGTFKNLLNYPENCSDWLKYLNAKNLNSPIYPILEIISNKSLKNTIHLLQYIFEKFNDLKVSKNIGDKVSLENIVEGNASFIDYYPLLKILSEFTHWEFRKDYWKLEGDDLKIIKVKKTILTNLTKKKYKNIIEKKNPISWAITANKRIEFTIEESNFLLF